MRQPSTHAFRLRQSLVIVALLAFAAALVAQAPPVASVQPLLLAHANVVDVTAGTIQRDRDVTIATAHCRGHGVRRTPPPSGNTHIDAPGSS
jgi:hypothetical protein